MPDWLVLVLLCTVAGAAIVAVAIFGEAVYYWLTSRAAGIRIPLKTLLRHRSTGTPGGAKAHKSILISTIRAQKAGLGLTFEDLAAHTRAGGDVARVVSALIGARHHDLPLEFADACQLDLAGEDPFEMVKQHAASIEEPADT